MKLYVVQVTHRVSLHVTGSVPILITDNAAVALTAACSAETAEYPLLANGDGTSVFRIEMGTMELGDIVFSRRREQRADGGWLVTWFDKELERTYAKVLAPLTA